MIRIANASLVKAYRVDSEIHDNRLQVVPRQGAHLLTVIDQSQILQ